MKRYIFDTGVLSLYFSNKLPVTEFFVKYAEKNGLRRAKDRILELKSFRGTEIVPKKFHLSLVNSYIL